MSDSQPPRSRRSTGPLTVPALQAADTAPSPLAARSEDDPIFDTMQIADIEDLVNRVLPLPRRVQ